MPLPNVFVTRKIAQPALDRLAGKAQVEVWQQDDPPPYDVLL